MDDLKAQETFDVGGVRLKQPFKIRRLGHIGFNVTNIEETMSFYRDLLGFRISDPLDFSKFHPLRDQFPKDADTRMYFMRHGTDHHSFVLMDQRLAEVNYARDNLPKDITINQLTWQVGSLGEVNRAIDWFAETGVHSNRVGRDMPGSNWMIYPFDPEGHRNELYYGMEQIGWNGVSKPREMHADHFDEKPELPMIAEFEEVRRAAEKGIDFQSGNADPENLPATYDVDGVMLPRPFKIVRHGPYRMFAHDVVGQTAFYCNTLGFTVTEKIEWNGHSCVFLRCNTEHHSLAIYPIALRAELGLSDHTTTMALGMQVATYRQLNDALAFLAEKGFSVLDIPPGLSPGIDHGAYVQDPSGHVVQFYFAMEQVGWDGKPRPASARNPLPYGQWPDILEGSADSYAGEPYLGPWG